MAANPALGEPAPIKIPGEFGPYDESESHLFTSPTNKGLHEGLAIGFGLRSPSEGLADTLADTWENLKEGAKQSFNQIMNYKVPPGQKPPSVVSLRGANAVALTVPNMIANGITGMKDLFEQGAKQMWEAREALEQQISTRGKSMGTPEQQQQFARGAGMILASLGQLAMGSDPDETVFAGKFHNPIPSLEDVAVKTGETLERRAPRPANAILRATNPKNYLYGKVPGRAFIDEPEPQRITNSIPRVMDNLNQAGERLHDAIDDHLSQAKIAAKTVNVKAPLNQIFRDALDDVAQQSGLRNRAGVVSAIKTLEDDVMNEHDVDGNVTRAMPMGVSPSDVNDLKRSVGKSTKWDTIPGSVDPEISGYVNDIRKKLYGTLNDLVEQAAPGTKALNARYANVIESSRLIATRLAREEGADLGQSRLLSREAWLGAISAFMFGGTPGKAIGAPIIASQIARSTAGRIARSRGMAAAGAALQSPVGRATASNVGIAASSLPAVSGAARRVLAGEEAPQ